MERAGHCRLACRGRSWAMAKLYFYYSAMNAGKTTTLLQSAHNYRERGMRVAILTPRLDHRDGSGTVASRIGLRADGTAFGCDDDLERMVRASVEANGPLHCVRVDDQGRALQAGPQVEIGGNERYVSVSRAEFKKIVRGEAEIAPLQAPLL